MNKVWLWITIIYVKEICVRSMLSCSMIDYIRDASVIAWCRELGLNPKPSIEDPYSRRIFFSFSHLIAYHPGKDFWQGCCTCVTGIYALWNMANWKRIYILTTNENYHRPLGIPADNFSPAIARIKDLLRPVMGSNSAVISTDHGHWCADYHCATH